MHYYIVNGLLVSLDSPRFTLLHTTVCFLFIIRLFIGNQKLKAVCERAHVCFMHSVLLGLGGAVREHKSAIHAIITVARSEGMLALYTGSVVPQS